MSDDGRLTTAVEESLELARQVPPSPDYPFLVVPFNRSASPARLFTDLPSLEGFLGSLRPSGGTDIAKGLVRGYEGLKPYMDGASHVALILITDGDHGGDKRDLDKAIAQLNVEFAKRQDSQLKNSVFCKRWNNAAVELASAFNAPVVDVAEGQLRVVGLDPSIEVESSTWDQEFGRLMVRLHAAVRLTGTNIPESLPSIGIRCLDPSAKGDTSIRVDPLDSRGKSFVLSLAIPHDIDGGGSQALEFVIDEPEVPGLTLTTWTTGETIPIVVDVPPRRRLVDIAPTIQLASDPYWSDPLQGRMSFTAKLVVKAGTKTGAAWPSPLLLEVTPSPALRWMEGPRTIALNGDGSQSYEFVLETTAERASTPQDLQALHVGFMVEARSEDPTLVPSEESFDLGFDLTVPEAVLTRISATPTSASKGEWVQLQAGSAFYNVDVDFHVDGPMVQDTVLQLQAPAGVLEMSAEPSRLRQGTNKIRLAFVARVAPIAQNAFDFAILPPPGHGAVAFEVQPRISFELPGPAPRQVFSCVKEGGPSNPIEILFPDRERKGNLKLTSGIVGGIQRAQVEGLDVVVQAMSQNGLIRDEETRKPFGSDFAIQFNDTSKRSLVFDARRPLKLLTYAQTETGAVVGSEQSVVLVFEAPLKRLLFLLVVVIGCLILGVVVYRTTTSLSEKRAEATAPESVY